jgi:hypothetical protein
MVRPLIASRRWTATALALGLALLSACGEGGGASTAATAPTAATQTPILPPTASAAATLSWTAPLENMDGSVLSNLAGFRIYYGMNSNVLDRIILIQNASVSTYVVDSLTSGTWFFAVSAVNAQGIESPLSNTASKRIP